MQGIILTTNKENIIELGIGWVKENKNETVTHLGKVFKGSAEKWGHLGLPRFLLNYGSAVKCNNAMKQAVPFIGTEASWITR